MGGEWVHVATGELHACKPPEQLLTVTPPCGPAAGAGGREQRGCNGGPSCPVHGVTRPAKVGTAPKGRRGDAWRCDCGRLWVIGDACEACRLTGGRPHSGYHTIGEAWVPASLWARWLYRRAGRRRKQYGP